MLSSKQRAFLTSIAAQLNPIVHLGKRGYEERFITALDKALEDHELVKMRFIDYKDDRKSIAYELAKNLHAELVRVLGHTAIFYRKSTNPDKQHINLP